MPQAWRMGREHLTPDLLLYSKTASRWKVPEEGLDNDSNSEPTPRASETGVINKRILEVKEEVPDEILELRIASSGVFSVDARCL
jgi:hypothetical protein